MRRRLLAVAAAAPARAQQSAQPATPRSKSTDSVRRTRSLCTPVKNVMMGDEFQSADRQNFADGFSSRDYRLQFSFKFSFGGKVIGG